MGRKELFQALIYRPNPTITYVMATRILVVDDERPMCDYVQTMLSQNGCVVESACSASEALAKLKAEPYDLVVTDFMMRGMNGRQLAWVLKSLYPRLPVILITGCCFPTGSLDAIDRVLLKPFSPRQLWTAIGEVFMRVLTTDENISPNSSSASILQVS
jgi:CheY-like chemotaxis protein